ncbi:TPA: hypothetical protein ACIZEA_000665 [Enterococcus faecalis]
MKKIALFSMLTFSVLSLSLAGCGNKKTASTNDSKPKQETKKATQKSSSQQEMKSSHSSVTGQNSNVTGENPSENATQPSAGTDETNEVPQNQAPDTNITITNVVFNPERNEINGTTLSNATITATVVGDASAQAGVFYADANCNFTVISPRAGATTQLIATVDQRNSAPVQIDIPSSGQETALSFSNITIDPKQGTISGKTAPNATILVSRADDARVILASFTADAQGNFTASNLVPGTKNRLDVTLNGEIGTPYLFDLPN